MIHRPQQRGLGNVGSTGRRRRHDFASVRTGTSKAEVKNPCPHENRLKDHPSSGSLALMKENMFLFPLLISAFEDLVHEKHFHTQSKSSPVWSHTPSHDWAMLFVCFGIPGEPILHREFWEILGLIRMQLDSHGDCIAATVVTLRAVSLTIFNLCVNWSYNLL